MSSQSTRAAVRATPRDPRGRCAEPRPAWRVPRSCRAYGAFRSRSDSSARLPAAAARAFTAEAAMGAPDPDRVLAVDEPPDEPGRQIVRARLILADRVLARRDRVETALSSASSRRSISASYSARVSVTVSLVSLIGISLFGARHAPIDRLGSAVDAAERSANRRAARAPDPRGRALPSRRMRREGVGG